MALPGQVQSAPPEVVGFDTFAVVDSATAQQAYRDGYRFCLRYLSLSSAEDQEYLSHDEALGILEAGLALMAVQQMPSSNESPTASLGTTDGTNAAANAQTIGLPRGVNIWLASAAAGKATSADAMISYCNAWSQAVTVGGYVPGLYVSDSTGLSSNQLYYDLQFTHYWASADKVPEVAVRGYQLIQSDPDTKINGVVVNRDTTQTDSLGGRALWLVDVSQSAR